MPSTLETQIDRLPEPPVKLASDFDSKADAWVAAMVVFRDQLVALIEEINQIGPDAALATLKAAEAAASAALAQYYAGNNVRGLDTTQAPSNAMLGTGAYLDQTWIYASTTWDAPSVANGAQTLTVVTVPGADIGDKLLLSASIGLGGLDLHGDITAQDTVKLYLSNLTGASVDLPSATYYITILKQMPRR